MKQPPYWESGNAGSSRGGRRPVTAAHSREDEMRLLEYLDGELAREHCKIVEEHLSQCTQCQTLSHRWQQLDSELTLNMPRPMLSPGFVTSLRERIGTEAPAPLAADRMQKRLQLEAELQRQWDDYRKAFFRAHLPGFLDFLGYGAIWGIGGCFLFLLLGELVKSLNHASQASLQLLLSTGAALTAILLVTAVAFAKKTRFTSW